MSNREPFQRTRRVFVQFLLQNHMDQSQLQQGAFNTVKMIKISGTVMEHFRTGDAFSTTKGIFTLYLFIKFRMVCLK